MNLLVISCSATKRPIAGEIPAIDRYDGPAYRVLRVNRPADLDVVILSAEHGFIPERQPIADYDRKLDQDRAAELARSPSGAYLRRMVKLADRVFVAGGFVYQVCFTDALMAPFNQVPADPIIDKIRYSAGGIGQQLGQLKRWLRSLEQARAA